MAGGISSRWKLGSFRATGSGQLGLFVQPARAGPGRQAQAGRSRCNSVFNPQSAIRNPQFIWPLPTRPCRKLALFRTIDPVPRPSRLWRIGFVLHNRSPGALPARPPGANWVRFAHFGSPATRPPVGVTKLGLFRIPRPKESGLPGDGPRLGLFGAIPPGWRAEAGPNWLCFARWVHGRLLLPASNFTLQTSPIYTPPPITCRVAGIVAEFCAHVAPQNRVTPCARRNKEFFVYGVFYSLDCCTKQIQPGLRPEPMAFIALWVPVARGSGHAAGRGKLRPIGFRLPFPRGQRHNNQANSGVLHL